MWTEVWVPLWGRLTWLKLPALHGACSPQAEIQRIRVIQRSWVQKFSLAHVLTVNTTYQIYYGCCSEMTHKTKVCHELFGPPGTCLRIQIVALLLVSVSHVSSALFIITCFLWAWYSVGSGTEKALRVIACHTFKWRAFSISHSFYHYSPLLGSVLTLLMLSVRKTVSLSTSTLHTCSTLFLITLFVNNWRPLTVCLIELGHRVGTCNPTVEWSGKIGVFLK